MRKFENGHYELEKNIQHEYYKRRFMNANTNLQ